MKASNCLMRCSIASNCRMRCSMLSARSLSARTMPSNPSFLSLSARNMISIFAILWAAQSWDVPSTGPPRVRALYEKQVPRTGVTFGPTYRTLPPYSGRPTACSYASPGAQRTVSDETESVAAGSVDKLYVIRSSTSSTYNTLVINKYFITRITNKY
jgi:hypothetical protein